MKILSSSYEKIRSATVVSFDIFDTLIGRTVASPSDVFRLMENDMSELVGLPLENFAELRKNAEKTAKQVAFETHGAEDITLRDIHIEMLSHIGVSLDVVEKSCEIEMAWERRCLIPREAGRELYELSRQLHKDIILVSDMYLPKSFIEEVLISHGYDGWVKFYLSAELGRTKTSGTIFENVISDFRVDFERILHIGDNPKGDVAVPKKLGMRTAYIPRTVNQLRDRFSFCKLVHQGLVLSDRTISSSVVAQALADCIFDDQIPVNAGALKDDPLIFGKALLGPLMAGYTTWIHNNARNAGVQKLLFLSRDGSVMQRAYNAMMGEDAIDNTYCLASRQIARICSIHSEWDIRRIVDEPIYSTEIGKLLDSRLGLKPDDVDRAKLMALGYSSLSEKIGTRTNRETLYELASHHRDLIQDNARAQRRAYKDYLKEKVGTADKVAVVDIGYSGTMQATMMRLLEKHVGGYYFATSKKHPRQHGVRMAAEAYFASDGVSPAAATHIGIHKHRFIYETIICSDEHSFEGFDISTSPATPVFWENSDAPNRANFVILAHEGVVQFCENLMQRWPLEKGVFSLEGHRASLPLDSFLNIPPPPDVALFEDIEFEDKFGPDLKRVLIASPRTKVSQPVEEIWKEGGRKTNNANMVEDGTEHKIAGSIKRMVYKIEKAIIFGLLSIRKVRKYEKDRQRFFQESQHLLLRIWGYWVV